MTLAVGDAVILRDGSARDGLTGEVDAIDNVSGKLLKVLVRWGAPDAFGGALEWIDPVFLNVLVNSKNAQRLLVDDTHAEMAAARKAGASAVLAADKRMAVQLARRAIPILESAMPLELRAAWDTVREGLHVAADALGVCED